MSGAPAGENVETTEPSAPRAERFFMSVVWSWMGVAANFFTAFFLSPYMIGKLGDERYGIWVLAFSLMEYCFFLDLGFRSAVVNFTSRHRAAGEFAAINEVINTAAFYFTAVSVTVLALAPFLAGHIAGFFAVAEGYRPDFIALIRLTVASWAIAFVFGTFQATLEAFQQFRVYNHIWIVSLVVRTSACALLLYFGYGLVALGVAVLASQVIGHILNFLAFRRVFPRLHFSWAFVNASRWKDMGRYGIHSFVANGSGVLLAQGAPVLIGRYQPEAYVGYYTLPARLLQYIVDAITRIGFVTAPNTAEMVALGRSQDVIAMGMHLNRYCLALFAPVSVFLLVFGPDLITVWVGARFASFSAPLIPAFVLSTSLALAAQFNSSSILFGMGKHEAYAKLLVFESLLLVGGLMVVIPAYGITGAAWLSAVLMIASRAIATPLILCRRLSFSFATYMLAIYMRPLLTAVPVYVLALLWAAQGWVGPSWPKLFLAAAGIASVYYALAYFTCLDRGHRELLRSWIGSRVRLPGFAR